MSLILLIISPTVGFHYGKDDYYDLLGASQNANVSEVKKAHYKLSLKYHLDRNPDLESRKLFI